MKKKLLSLVLAGAMVATTSVSAFAAATDKVIDSSDNTEVKTDVTITGEVLSDTGARPEGRFNVTIPTAASFTVSQDGNLQGTTIKVSNKGTQNIDVYADRFVDTQNGTGINVVAESALKSADRTNVSLSLAGNINTLYLKSAVDGDFAGLYTDKALNTQADAATSKIATVKSNQEVDLTLSGKAGETSATLERGVSNNFTLTLKIKKSAK